MDYSNSSLTDSQNLIYLVNLTKILYTGLFMKSLEVICHWRMVTLWAEWVQLQKDYCDKAELLACANNSLYSFENRVVKYENAIQKLHS